MATICFRPPPLPPLNRSKLMRTAKRSVKNSSTYMSFRDPSDDDVIVAEKQLKKSRRVSHTNSLNRCDGLLKYHGSTRLNRSHSDSNLSKIDDESYPNSNNNNNNNGQLSISRYMRVLSGSWKNLLNLGGMSRPPKPAATAKKVAPPAVPHEFRHSGSSFGSSTGYFSSEDGMTSTTTTGGGGFLAPLAEPQGVRDDHSDYGSTGKSPGPIYGSNATFTFPGQSGAVLTHKAAVYYHHQLSLQEDQGIDMTQSPGRDSPGSSSGSAGSGSRHSTASLDSGRASYHPLSTAGRSTIGSSNSPRCSLSSCSIGSDHGRIDRMIQQGVPDPEIIHSLLVDLQFEEYYSLFVAAGYDLPTIGRMTPEDLTAIGIKKPNHRKRLKAEIAQLNLPDNLPEFVPGSLEEWLQILRLDEYLPAFLEQGYQTIDDVTQLAWEDLEEFGIVKLGHQKKIVLAIKRVKDIKAGKRISEPPGRIYQDVVVHHQAGDCLQQQQQPPPIHTSFRSFHQPWEVDQTRMMSTSVGPHLYQSHYQQQHQPHSMFCPTDIVPIQIRTGRGKSLESLEDPGERTHLTFMPENNPQTVYYQTVGSWRRSYDDGDITPTNEGGLLYEGGGTLPRPRGIIRPRPIAKITAKARNAFPDFEKPQFNPEKYANPAQYKTLPPYVQYNNNNNNQQMGRKIPPNPPKRRDSECSEEAPNTTTVEIHHHHHHHHGPTSSPLPLPAYPSSDSLSISLDSGGDLPLPPPPAPGTPPPRLNSSQSWGAEEQELIKTLALQHRNGSDASFKSSSSTESDSLPFANENAGTIRTRAAAATRAEFVGSPKPRPAGLPAHPSPTPSQTRQPATRSRSEPADVLNDIGNMLANLTDELDAMLEEEKRQQ